MPSRFNPPYTVGFVAALSVVCAVLLSGAATGLKPLQDANKKFDIRRNIVAAFGAELPDRTPDTINNFFDAQIRGRVVSADGKALDLNAEAVDLDVEDRKPAASRAYPFFELLGEDGQSVAGYAIPILGKGLWSSLYGYISLDRDLNTVRGITFYKHGETPGLGAEISEPWFQDNFRGKKLHDAAGTFQSVRVIKGKVSDAFPNGNDHAVDGISGATITSNGVTDLLREDLGAYLNILRKLAN